MDWRLELAAERDEREGGAQGPREAALFEASEGVTLRFLLTEGPSAAFGILACLIFDSVKPSEEFHAFGRSNTIEKERRIPVGTRETIRKESAKP